MTTAPAQDQRRLLDLQALDTRVIQLKYRGKNHPGLARLAELESQITDLHGAAVTAQASLSDLKRELTKAEGDVDQVKQRAERHQTRLDSGQVGAKDAQALTAELDVLANRISVLEDIQLSIMEQVEDHEDSVNKLLASENELAAAKAELIKELKADRESIIAELEQVARERAELVSQIDAGLVALYDKIRASNDGIGAAALRRGISEASGMRLGAVELDHAKNAPEDEVLRCEETDVILVRGEDSF